MAGQGRLALIEGPAGIGKTRLLQEVRRLAAAEGARVLTARGSQLEREFGFGAVRQLFETALADPADRADLLRGVGGRGRLGVRRHRHRRAGGPGRRLVRGPARPLLADRQPRRDRSRWCSRSTTCSGATPARCGSSAYLLRRLEGLPVLVVATLRTGEQHADEELLAELAEDLATVRGAPRTAGLRRRRRPGAGTARRADAHDAVRRRLPPHHGRQPAAAAAAAARPGDRGRAAGRLARRHGRRRSARGRCRAWC